MFLQKGAPTAYFTEQDFKLMEQTLEEALKKQPEGATSDWENPKSGSSGKITIVQSYEAQGLPCKRVKAFNTAKDRSSEGEFDFCEQTDGQWKAVPTGPQ
jgi:surface antigen